MSQDEQSRDESNDKQTRRAFPHEGADENLLPFEVSFVGSETNASLIRIDRWNLVACGWFEKHGKLYAIFKLSGVVTGHPRQPDGAQVKTTDIIASVGRIVHTASGRSYILSGNPEPQYLQARQHFDPQNPLLGISFEF